MSTKPLRDVQSETDYRRLPIQKVGVKGVSYPITVQDRANGTQETVATVQMYVDLPHHFRGTHMSRFIELLNRHRGNIASDNLRQIMAEMRQHLSAEVAHIELVFPYFIEKTAPVSGSRSLQGYTCTFSSSLGPSEEDLEFVLTVEVPVTTLCPCSREMSERGAHNQRSVVTVSARFEGFLWLEELIAAAEASASCPLYPLLKRSDEKFVTDQAYNNPRFVEDVVRECATLLGKLEQITWFRIEAENFESIHNHNAYAMIDSSQVKAARNPREE